MEYDFKCGLRVCVRACVRACVYGVFIPMKVTKTKCRFSTCRFQCGLSTAGTSRYKNITEWCRWMNEHTLSPGDTLPCLVQHTVTRRHSAMLGTTHCHPATLCHAWYNTLSPGDILPCLVQHTVTRRHSAMLSTARCHPATLCHA